MSTPIGPLKVVTQDGYLTAIHLNIRHHQKIPDPIAREVIDQLLRYFKNPQIKFDVPMRLFVSPFQQRVLKALQKIPLGKTITYGELAQQLNTNPRSIGMACRYNPIPIIIPCHRVVAKNHLGGYSGDLDGPNMDIKRWLLNHEGVALA